MAPQTPDERLDLFARACDRFFAQAAELSAGTALAGPVVAALAALTALAIRRARASFEAELAAPLGLTDAEYHVPTPAEALAYFRDAPDPPELAAQFAPELAANDWRALQAAHRVLYEVLVFHRPAVCWAFRVELRRRDYRAVVDRYDALRAAADAALTHPETRAQLQRWFDLLTGRGPETDDPSALETLRAHWRSLLAAAAGAAP